MILGELKVGDHVVLFPWIDCGDCGMCRNGYKKECDLMLGNSLGIGRDGG